MLRRCLMALAVLIVAVGTMAVSRSADAAPRSPWITTKFTAAQFKALTGFDLSLVTFRGTQKQGGIFSAYKNAKKGIFAVRINRKYLAQASNLQQVITAFLFKKPRILCGQFVVQFNSTGAGSLSPSTNTGNCNA